MAQQNELQIEIKTVLDDYSHRVWAGFNKSGSNYAKNVMASIRKNGPLGRRGGKRGGRKVDKDRPHLRNSIRSIDESKSFWGTHSRFVLYFTYPNRNIAHLLEEKHKSRDKTIIVPGTHFIRKALEAERPKFEKDLKEAIKNA